MRSAAERKQEIDHGGRRDLVLRVRLSRGEMDAFDARAASFGVPGLTRSAAARALLLGGAAPADGQPPAPPPEPRGVGEAREQIRSAGVLLNQLAHVANAAAKSGGNANELFAAMTALREIGEATAQLRRAADALEAVAAGGA